MLKEKTIVLGVSGGIAVYKTCELVRRLKEKEADVHVVMTRGAERFVTPLTFQALSGNPVHTNLFNLIEERFSMGVVRGSAGSPPDFSEPSGLASGERISEIGHIALAEKAHLVVIAPATANIIAKIAHGICDDLLTTLVCATRAPLLISPSMNVHMWENRVTQENVKKLKQYGFHILEPDTGPLACGTTGKGRLPETDVLLREIEKIL